jgi:bifunctional non-homologous end joining protein LigD
VIPREWSEEIASAAAGAFSFCRPDRSRGIRAKQARKTPRRAGTRARSNAFADVYKQLEQIEADGGDGRIAFGGGKTLKVSSLDKIYFPETRATKGDVMRYYTRVAPLILPVIADRPLTLKRYPEGITGSYFFQQNAGSKLPPGVRTARIVTETGERATRIVGGDLLTLLYIVQIGTIAVHAWQARLSSANYADTATIDLDPGEDVPFSDVVVLAKHIKAELDRLHLAGALKTSGSSGLHVVVPLPPKTAFDVAARLAERIAEHVVEKHPNRATLERSIKARPAGSIYVDAQQNAKGKTVVAAYSVRERPYATVSAPLAWRELRRSLRLDAFTIDTVPARLRKVGDLWGEALKQRNTPRAIDRVLDE